MANSGSNKVWSVVSLGTMHNRGSAVWKPTVPGTPTFVNPEGGETIYFAPSANGGSAITNWYASISPDGPTLTLDTPDPENGGSVTISNYEWNTPYMLSVWAENEIGEGPPSVLPVEFVAVWNEATGGDVTIDHDYNGSGESWKIHTFTTSNASDGLNVSVSVHPFRVLVVGGGGASKFSINSGQGGGGAGGMITNDDFSLDSIEYNIVVGAGGTVGTWPQNGQDTTAFGLTAIGGGHGAFRDGGQIGPGSGGSGGGESRYNTGPGGAGTAGQGTNGGSGDGANHGGGGGAGGVGRAGSGGPGKASDITGANVTYARGGGSDGWDNSVQYGAGGNHGGLAAQSGIVIVAYRIG
jgi:hypothetical protein